MAKIIVKEEKKSEGMAVAAATAMLVGYGIAGAAVAAAGTPALAMAGAAGSSVQAA